MSQEKKQIEKRETGAPKGDPARAEILVTVTPPQGEGDAGCLRALSEEAGALIRRRLQ